MKRSMMKRLIQNLSVGLIATFTAPHELYAQALPVTAKREVPAAASEVFDAQYFLKYSPATAEDMVRRVPGATAILDGLEVQLQVRGFGSGGDQLLLNGKRFAGKGQILPTLRRIPSANVAYVELVRGTDTELDVQSEGLIVNVVLKEGVGTGTGSWEARTRISDEGSINADGLISHSNNWGALDYIVGLERTLWSPAFASVDWTERERQERYFYPNGALSEYRSQSFERYHNKYIATANLAYNFSNGDRLRLNGLYEPRDVHEDDDTDFVRFGQDGTPILSAVDVHRKHTDWLVKWEAGGDYVASVGPGTLNLLFIHTFQNNPVDEYRNLDLGTRVVELSRNLTVQDTTETILRGSYQWPLPGSQSLEVGAEGARNVLEQSIRVFFDLDQDGLVQEVPIPTAQARVEELRGEVFAVHHWQISEPLSLETSLNFEYSEISNNYPFSPGYSDAAPKPRADLRYNITETDQVRLKVERTVSQLQFTNFVPTFDVVDNEIDAGNPDLRTEKTWKYEAAYQRRLPRGQGQLDGRVFYNDISDHIDKFLLRVEPDGERVSAIGNIGSAKLYGFEAKGSVRLALLGLPDLLVDARFLRAYSKTTDPFTGAERTIANALPAEGPWKNELDLGFRHDITSAGISYGVKYQRRGGTVSYSDIRVQRIFARGPRLEAFFEKKLGYGLTARIDGYGLLPQRNREYQDRILYSDDVIAGTVLRTETYVERRDRRFTLSLRGTF